MEIYNNILYYEELSSTNVEAFILNSKENCADFTVVCAHNQTAGKGQRGNVWLSENGKNCLFSVILHPAHIKANKQFIVSQIVSLAVVEALSKYSIQAHIKWPNDIYVGNKKIAGILIENILLSNSITDSIIGIGLNVNQTEFDPSLPNPISMRLINNTELSLTEVLQTVISEIKLYYQDSIDKVSLAELYKSKLYLFNKEALFQDADGQFIGKIIDVDAQGKLYIQKENAEILSYYFKEVSYFL